jgi:acylphosphatase
MSLDESRLHALVSGYVQGVGYRWFVRQHALLLGLTGFACNLRDGRVEVVAEGAREALERFVATLRRGPEGADVAAIDVGWEAPRHEFSGFSIQR